MTPERWQRQALGESIKLISGQHVAAALCNDIGLGVPYLTGPSDFPNGRIEVTRYVERPKVLCEPGDVLLTVKGSGTGKSVVADRQYAIGRQLMALRPVRIDGKYLAIVVEFHEPDFGDASTGLIPGLTRGDVLEFPILLPPVKEQAMIAQLLETWDRAIKKTIHLIAEQRERKRGLMQVLLTGKKRFREFGPTSSFQRTRYGEIPADWAYVPISNIASEVSDRNTSGEDYPVLTCTKHEGLVDSLEYFGKRVYSADTSSYRVVCRGEFAYATNHIEEGSLGYQDIYGAGLVSPMYTVFRTKAECVDNDFLFSLLKTEHYRQIFASMTNASVDRRGSLRWKDFRTIRVPLPSISEQRKISSFLSTADTEIENLESQLEAYRLQERGLKHALLTGKKRITVEQFEAVPA